jgi:DNA polymerase I
MKKLYLVDVSSLFFRAFYAIPPLRTSQGLPTNALYGFLSMVIKLLRENKPDYMAFCYDRKEPSFRHELYADYKANRTEMPEDLEPQIPYIKKLTEVLGIFGIEKDKFEADDLIGTLALLGAKENCDVSIVSGDKDFAQLVNDRISMYDTMKNVRYDRHGVIEKWGVAPEQMIDYLAIIGDSSDNIPGVHGVGPKGAQKLLAEFKTLKGIYENVTTLKSESLRSKLLESKKDAFIAQHLVTIVTDVKLGLSLDDLKLKAIDKEHVTALLEELEFGGFLKKLFGGDDESAASDSGKTKKSGKEKGGTEKTVSEKKPSEKKIAAAQIKVGAIENTQWSLAELKKKVQPYDDIWAVSTERGFCLGYEGKAIQVDATLAEIGEVLASKNLGWRGFDVKSIWHACRLPTSMTPKWDSMLAAYLVKAGAIGEFSEVYEKYLGRKIPDLAGPEDYLKCELELESVLRPKLEEANLIKVLDELELPLVPVLYDMEVKGIAVDREDLKKQSVTLTKDIDRLEKEIFVLSGESFNISSPKQLGTVLFEKLKIPMMKKTKTGYSTDSDVLSKLAPQYPICDLVINYRELSKLKSTYVDALPELIDPVDHRLHTRFYQALTQTGRLSSANPNLQNIPIRTARGREIRHAFKAKKGHVLLSFDYSQIELRVLAEITGDPGLLEAFKKNIDIHAATASEVFGVPVNDVTPEQRRMAKAVNFGIAYGQGVFGLADSLEISRDEAKGIIEGYFLKFKKVKEFMLDTVQVAKKQGYVETLFGRRRYIDEFNSANGAVRKFGERAAINAPIQGTASDLMKKAMIEAHGNSTAAMILQVHDELLFECPEGEIENEARATKKILEGVANWQVPLSVNVAWGENWDDAHA